MASYLPVIKKPQERSIALYSQEQNADAVFKFYTEIKDKRKN
jgi:hypothetical protein